MLGYKLSRNSQGFRGQDGCPQAARRPPPGAVRPPARPAWLDSHSAQLVHIHIYIYIYIYMGVSDLMPFSRNDGKKTERNDTLVPLDHK